MSLSLFLKLDGVVDGGCILETKASGLAAGQIDNVVRLRPDTLHLEAYGILGLRQTGKPGELSARGLGTNQQRAEDVSALLQQLVHLHG